MKFVMNKIMSIDKDAESYRKSIDELLEKKQNELDNKIKDMLALFKEESQNIKNDIGKEKISEAECRAENIRKEKQEELNNINAKYQSNKFKIIESVFNGIINPL